VLKRRAKHGPIGLDIGAASIKMLQFADQGGGPAVIAAAYCQLPLSQDNPGRGDAALEYAIAEALQQHPFCGRNVVAALSCREFQMKNIRLPRMPVEEKASAIQFEAQDRFGTEGGEQQIRHLIAGEVRHGNELKEEIIVFAATEEVVAARVRMLEALKLKPVAIDIAPCAVARSFFRFLRRAEDLKAVNVFLDVGRRGTSIVLTRGLELSFLKMVNIGGEHFNDAVAQALSIPQEEAADLRIRIIRQTCSRRTGDRPAVPEEMQAAVADAVRPLIERISREVQLCLRYFAVTFRGQQPQSLTLVGGEAHAPTLIRIIGEDIDIPCTIGNPLRGIRRIGRIGGLDQRALQPAWAVACGLAMRGSPWVQRPDALSPSLPTNQVAV
jgi:type IV pilus assembly protein PilM